MSMEFHVGRLIDHVHLVVRDIEASKRFYRAVLGVLGRDFQYDAEDAFSCDELFVSAGSVVGDHSTGPHRVHLAFQVPDRETVGRFHEAGLAAGGRDNGAPGERPYHPGYYGAFVLDPDGNNIEAVHHGPARRSAESIVVTPEFG